MSILTMTRHVSSVSVLYLTFYSEAHCDSHVLYNDNIPNGAARHDAEKEQRMAKCDSSANLLQ